jgi:hypothetical protein
MRLNFIYYGWSIIADFNRFLNIVFSFV